TAGSYLVLRVSDADPQVLSELAEAGVLPEARIEVVTTAADSVTVVVDQRRRAVKREFAAAVSRGPGAVRSGPGRATLAFGCARGPRFREQGFGAQQDEGRRRPSVEFLLEEQARPVVPDLGLIRGAGNVGPERGPAMPRVGAERADVDRLQRLEQRLVEHRSAPALSVPSCGAHPVASDHGDTVADGVRHRRLEAGRLRIGGVVDEHTTPAQSLICTEAFPRIARIDR